MKKEKIEFDDSKISDNELLMRATIRALSIGKITSDAEDRYQKLLRKWGVLND